MRLYEVPEVVANDTLNLLCDVQIIEEYKDFDDIEFFGELDMFEECDFTTYTNALNEILPYIDEPLWRNGALVPFRVREWMSELDPVIYRNPSG